MTSNQMAVKARPETPDSREVVAQAVGLSRHYGDTIALNQVDFTVREGELIGLLGPNGAGKSTLLNTLVGLRKPTSGNAELFGGDPSVPANRKQLGMTLQETGVPATLKVAEAVDLVAAHYPNPENRDELLSRLGLGEIARRQCGGLSGGQKRRLSLALAFVGRPRLVVLDEPTTGLDVESRRLLWDHIRGFHSRGGTVLLTTHYLEEVEALAQRVVVMGKGEVLADDTVDAVRGLATVQRVSMVAERLPELPGVISEERIDKRIHLMTHDADQLIRSLVKLDAEFSGLEVQQATLEEAFLTISRS